jgi:glycosyltransferase involved in cell wall biosynthesis
MTIAWFSPLPPDRSGVAAYSAELLGRLGGAFSIDTYPERVAHEFVWRNRRDRYDLIVYQLGNSRAHDYMWGFMPRFPGLVVLHDARLHHARARQLLAAGRADDYRAEFVFNHPDARPEAAEYAIEGLAGSIYYFWPMLRLITATARAVAVHNRQVASDLSQEYPDAAVSGIRMGVPRLEPSADARTRIRTGLSIAQRAIVFTAFGKVTAEKRIASIVRALGALAGEGLDVHLLLVGDADEYRQLQADTTTSELARRISVTGFVADEQIADYLEASDVCLCLRWPTAQETSASWLRCLAARRPTVITSLAHLADVPESVALRVDLLDEHASLAAAMRRLATDAPLRAAVAAAGHRHWSEHHTLGAMADDYSRLLRHTAALPPPTSPVNLPAHITRDYSESARATLARFGVAIDLFR